MKCWPITGYATGVTLWVLPLQQELLTLQEHLNLSPFSVLLNLWFLCSILQFIVYPLSFGHCIVYPSYGFWLPLWYLQTNFYDKRDDCDCEFSSFIPASLAYRVYITQLINIPEVMIPFKISLKEDCSQKWKLHNQWLLVVNLKSLFHHFNRFTFVIMTWSPVTEYLCHRWL